jgi:ATP-dependent Clp protease ATP-binding subunit ClpC
VRRKPYSVILLDEIEKAHHDIFNILLQVLDDGILTDGLGRRIDFRNTIIIMTSNVGAKELREFGTGIGFGSSSRSAQSYDHVKSTLEGALRKVFRPEFLNRVDDVLVFRPLEKEHIMQIIEIALAKVKNRIASLGNKLVISQEVKEFIAEKGFDSQFGARPLNRAIQKYIEDLIADELLSATIKPDAVLELIMDEEKQLVKIQLDTAKSVS